MAHNIQGIVTKAMCHARGKDSFCLAGGRCPRALRTAVADRVTGAAKSCDCAHCRRRLWFAAMMSRQTIPPGTQLYFGFVKDW